ncbi:hypothetical protein [Nocardioides panacihumi]
MSPAYGDRGNVLAMVVAITTPGVYLIVALVILLIVCVGVFLAYRMSSRSDQSGARRATRPRSDDPGT